MVQIEKLNMRIPGVSKTEAQEIVQTVSHDVVRGLSTQSRDRRMEAVKLRVRVPSNSTQAQTSRLITEAILKGLV